MVKPKISIIVPINNVEGYLPSCLDSLINQTLKKIEIICINDGSTDGSKDVLERYSKEDSRVVVINEKVAKGQAAARNQGLKIAKGEYIGFVDGDDWVERNMYEKLYENAKKNDTDIAMCATHLHNEYTESSSHNIPYYNLNVFNDSFDNRAFTAQETADFIFNINVAIWNKIYKKDFLQKINATFQEGYIYEDLPFFFETYLKADKISLIRDFLYFYRTNRFGSTMSNFGVKVLDRIEMVSLTYQLLKAVPYYETIKLKVVGWIIDDLFHRYTMIDERNQREYYYCMQKFFRDLDLEGIDETDLRKFYSYKEYLLVKKSSYEECTRNLFLRYKDSKKTVEQIKCCRIAQIKEIKDYYDEIINAKSKYAAFELKNQKEWFENKIELTLESCKKGLEPQKQTELLLQKNYYENEIKKILEEQKSWFEEEIEKKIRETKDLHKSELEERVNEFDNQNQILQEKVSELDNQNQVLQEKVSELDNQNQILQERVSEFDNQNQVLQEKVSEFDNQNQVLQEKVSELDNQNQVLQEKVSELDNQNQVLQERVSEFDNQNQVLQEKVSELDNQNQVLQEKVSELDNQNQMLQEKVSKLDNQKSMLEEGFEYTKREIETWHNNNLQEKLLEQKKDYDRQIQKLRQEYSDYINMQKISYEKEISHVEVALKVVKKLKNINRKIKNKLTK